MVLVSYLPTQVGALMSSGRGFLQCTVKVRIAVAVHCKRQVVIFVFLFLFTPPEATGTGSVFNRTCADMRIWVLINDFSALIYSIRRWVRQSSFVKEAARAGPYLARAEQILQ